MYDKLRAVAWGVALALAAWEASPLVAQPSRSRNAADDREVAPPYQPAVPNAPQIYGGGYGGYYSPGTVEGSVLHGMASVAQAAGNYNLSTSAAAVNMTQARKQQIQNYDAAVNTYFATRQVNKQARAAERGPPLSEADRVRIAHSGAPKPLSSSQLDPVSGQIAWPELLQDKRFDKNRATFDQVFEVRAQYGALPSEESRRLQAASENMQAQLKGMIQEVNSMEYMQAKRFIQSLAYEARKPVT